MNESINLYVFSLLGSSSARGMPKTRGQLFDTLAGSVLGVGEDPARGVAGHIELRHYTDAAGARVGDDFAHLVLGVELPQGRGFGEARKFPAFGAEALVVTEVPVEDVELGEGHAVERALDFRDGLEVAADVEHIAAPAKAGCVVDGDGGDSACVVLQAHQLDEGLHAVHGAYVGCRSQGCLGGRDVELIAFVFVGALDRSAGASHFEGEHVGCGIAGLVLRAADFPALAVEAIEKAIEGRVEAGIVLTGEPGVEMRGEVQGAGAHGDGTGEGHQVEVGCGGLLSRCDLGQSGVGKIQREAHHGAQAGTPMPGFNGFFVLACVLSWVSRQRIMMSRG